MRPSAEFWRAVLAGAWGGLVVFCVHTLFDSLFVHSVNVQVGVLLGLGLVAAERVTRQPDVAVIECPCAARSKKRTAGRLPLSSRKRHRRRSAVVSSTRERCCRSYWDSPSWRSCSRGFRSTSGPSWTGCGKPIRRCSCSRYWPSTPPFRFEPCVGGGCSTTSR